MKNFITFTLFFIMLTSLPLAAQDFRRTFNPVQIKEFTEMMEGIADRVDPTQAQTHCDNLEIDCSNLLDMWAMRDLGPAMVAVFANPRAFEKIIYLTPRVSSAPIIISDQPFEIVRTKEVTNDLNTQFINNSFGFVKGGVMFSIERYQGEGFSGVGHSGPCNYPGDEEKQIPIVENCIIENVTLLDFSNLSFKSGAAPE